MSGDERKACEDLFGKGVTELMENGVRLIVLPVVNLPAGCEPKQAMGIYVASPFNNYESRLFLEAPIRLRSGSQPQTTTQVLCGRTMYAASIQGISATLPVHQAVLAHVARYEELA
jgi:hypothetical protein